MTRRGGEEGKGRKGSVEKEMGAGKRRTVSNGRKERGRRE